VKSLTDKIGKPLRTGQYFNESDRVNVAFVDVFLWRIDCQHFSSSPLLAALLFLILHLTILVADDISKIIT